MCEYTTQTTTVVLSRANLLNFDCCMTTERSVRPSNELSALGTAPIRLARPPHCISTTILEHYRDSLLCQEVMEHLGGIRPPPAYTITEAITNEQGNAIFQAGSISHLVTRFILHKTCRLAGIFVCVLAGAVRCTCDLEHLWTTERCEVMQQQAL